VFYDPKNLGGYIIAWEDTWAGSGAVPPNQDMIIALTPIRTALPATKGWRYPLYDLERSNFYPFPSTKVVNLESFSETWSVEGSKHSGFLTADINSDGRLEVIYIMDGILRAANFQGSTLWERSVSGYFLAGIEELSQGGTNAYKIMLGSGVAGGVLRVMVLDNQGNVERTFERGGGYDSCIVPLTIKDFNGDGKLELLAQVDAGYSLWPRGAVLFDYQSGNEIYYYSVGPAIRGFNPIGDITGDGVFDVVIGTSSVHNGGVGSGVGGRATITTDSQCYVIAFRASDGEEIFTQDFGTHLHGSTFVSLIKREGGLMVTAMQIHDYWYPGNNWVRILDREGKLIKEWIGPYINELVGGSWAIADLTGDGKEDVLVVYPGLGKLYILNHELQLVKENSVGRLRYEIPVGALARVYYYSSNPVVNDINGDGKNEILIFDGRTGRLRIFNDNLEEIWSYQISPQEVFADMILSDLNGDGIAEILAAYEKDGYSKLVVLSAPPVLKILPVPYYSQGVTEWCLPTSMSMIFKYYGQNIHSWDIAKDWGWERDVAWWKLWEISEAQPWNVESYFESHGLVAEYIRYVIQNPIDFDTISTWIDTKGPVLLALTYPINHAVVVVGYNRAVETVYVNDPSGRLLEKIFPPGELPDGPYIAIELRWSDIPIPWGSWAMVIEGTPSAPAGSINVIDRSVKTDHIETNMSFTAVYSWLYGLDKGLIWENSQRHPLCFDPKDLFLVGDTIVNHTESQQDYLFQVEFAKEGYSKSFWTAVRDVKGRSTKHPIFHEIWHGIWLSEIPYYGDYVVTLRLWSADGSEKYDEVIFPKIKYTKTLSLSLHSAASFYIIDPQGRRIGIDPKTGQVINEIPGAVYAALENEPQFIIISDPLIGIYDVKLLGTATGTYALNLEFAIPSGTIVQTYTGNIVQGQILTCTMNVSENDVTSSEPTRVPPSVLVDKLSMAHYIKLELLWLNTTVSNMEVKQDVKEGLVDKLNNATEKIDQAINWIEISNEQANNMLNVAGNIMNAFIKQVNAQKGKAIVASEANDLITNAQNIILDIETAKGLPFEGATPSA
jgi:hypothetical protein